MKLVREWFAALCSMHSILPRLAFRKRTLEEELQEAMLRGSLRKTFGGFDVLCLGLGVLIGSGWAQFTGTAGVYAGPALIISVVTSGVVALLAGICYAELCVEFPVSGGAFSYVMITFGELAGFLTVASLVLEYVTGMALVARGFSTYLARMFNKGAAFFRLGPETVSGGQYDVMALGIVLFISAVMTLGMRESAFITTYTTVLKIALLLVVCIVGFIASEWSNMEPFLSPKFEEDGIFLGASIMFFSYVGFDALGMAAEEVKNINHIPWAIVGSISASGVLYFMLAFCLVLMTAPNVSCPNDEYLSSLRRLNFITVFDAVGRGYMAYVVSVAAVLGSLASLIVGLFSVSRVVMAASRDWLLPPFLARVSPRTQTPIIAQLCLGVVIAVIGMVVNNNAMVPLVSFGALGALWLVCNAMMYRRYIPEVQVSVTRHGTIKATSASHSLWAMPFRLRMEFSQMTQKVLVWAHMLMLNAVCIGLSVYYQVTATKIPDEYAPEPTACNEPTVVNHTLATVWWLVAWAVVTLSMQFWCPLEYEPAGWHVPRWLMPWLPSTATLLVVFSVAALPNSGYWKIGAYYAGCLVFYLLFSLPMSYVKHSRVDFVDDGYTVVELAFIEGTWRPARQALMLTGTTKYGGASSGGATSPANRSVDLKGFYPSGSGALTPATRSIESKGYPSIPPMSPATRSVDLRGNYPSTAGGTSPGNRSVDLRSFYPSTAGATSPANRSVDLKNFYPSGSGIARISGSSSSTAMTRGVGSGGGMTAHSGTTSAVLPMVLEHASPGGGRSQAPVARPAGPSRAKSAKSVTSS